MQELVSLDPFSTKYRLIQSTNPLVSCFIRACVKAGSHIQPSHYWFEDDHSTP